MAKVRPELCMFCGESPCECSKPKPPKKRPSREASSTPKAQTSSTKKQSEPTSPSVESTDLFKDAVIPIAKPAFKKPTQASSERDLSYLSALRNLRSIMAPDEQKKIDAELRGDYPQDLDRKITEIRKEVDK